ncbi:response regulator [Pseudomonas sp. P2757]|uniref:response regulator n=1 Tax=unclassified Pseudomonas TaxID=196821 RepID=UPI003B5963A7
MNKALIADDHPVIQSAVSLILQALGFGTIYLATSGVEALSVIREHQPDIVILDLKLKKGSGLEVLERIRSSGLSSRVLVYSAAGDDHYMGRCRLVGAMGYVNKAAPLQQLRDAIKALMTGYTFFPESAFNGSRGTPHSSERQMIDQLSDRELQILVQLAAGKANKDIAVEMYLSHKTISTYKTRLMLKLGLSSLVLLREFATRNGLI